MTVAVRIFSAAGKRNAGPTTVMRAYSKAGALRTARRQISSVVPKRVAPVRQLLAHRPGNPIEFEALPKQTLQIGTLGFTFLWGTFVIAGDPLFQFSERQTKVVGAVTAALLGGVLLLKCRSPCGSAGSRRLFTNLERAQTGIVVAFGSSTEFMASEWLDTYYYRLGHVPSWVFPGHGLVYVAAMLGSQLVSVWSTRAQRVFLAGTVAIGATWSLWGVAFAERADAVGAGFFACLLGIAAGKKHAVRLVYASCWWAVSYIELLGTGAGTWTWRDGWGVIHPELSKLTSGNPPSGIAGGYACFDCLGMGIAAWALQNISCAIFLSAGSVGLCAAIAANMPKPVEWEIFRQPGGRSGAGDLQ